MMVRASADEGESWPFEQVIHEGPAAYSSMAMLPDGQVGILYEKGDKSPYETVTFTKFPLEWLVK
jgi:sialidase-1